MRPSPAVRRAWVALVAAGAGLACHGAQEHAVLDRFFAASRLRDTTRLAEVATVVFEPLEHGIVTGFEVLSVSAPDNGTAARTVTVRAPVKRPDGNIVDSTFPVVLEWRGGRWIVTAFEL